MTSGAASPADAARQQAEGALRRKVVRRARATVDSVTGAPVARGSAPAPARAASPADAARAAASPADAARSRARRTGGDVDPDRGRYGADVGAGAGALMAQDRRDQRRKTAIVAVVLVALVCASLCYTMSTPKFIAPWEVLQIFGLRIQQLFGQLTGGRPITAEDAMDLHPTFYWTLTHLGVTLKYVAAGFMLACAGALYQNVFRNPIASPAQLGVSSGIQLGVGVMLLLFGTAAGGMMLQRYAFCYAAVIVILVLLFALSFLMTGPGRPMNVVNMLLVGTIINQFIGVVVTYLEWFVFDDELLDIFMSLTTMVQPGNDLASWLVLLGSFAVAVVPVWLLRFRLNAVNFDAATMRMFGVDATKLQLLALACGTVMMVAAQLQVGAVAMVTLVVPHLSRAVFGAEFRKQLVGTMLLGAVVLVACHIVSVAIPYDGTVPIGVVVNLLLLPAFVWMIATQQRRWN